MNAETEAAIQAAVEGDLSAEARSALNEALRSDPAALTAYCLQFRLHSLLAWRAGVATKCAPEPGAGKMVLFPARTRPSHWSRWAAAAVLTLLGALILIWSPSRASAAVDRVLQAMRQGDRTYHASVLAGDARQRLNNGRTLTWDGAELHLRGASQFLLIRPLLDGGARFTGSDGTANWDIIGGGPVRLSSDPGRFRGGLPGEQQEVPFLDLTSPLAGLKEGYDVSLHNVPGEPWHARLVALKRSRDVRGPRELDLTFRRDTGTIVTLDLRGLPRARGGPEALRLALSSEAPLPADHFSHASHHEPTRQIISE